MKLKNKNLRNSLLMLNIFIIFIISFLFWIFYYSNITNQFLLESTNLQKKLTTESIDSLNVETNNLKETINILNINSENLMKNDIKNSLDNVHSILNTVYNENIKEHNKDNAKQLILKTIKSFKNSRKNGYYFAIDMNSTITYVHSRKDFIGKTMKQIAGQNAVDVFNSYKKALIASSFNGAYAYAKVAKPNTKSMQLYEKVTYVKEFEPLGIMIGIGVYLDDYLDFEKKQILTYLKNKKNQNVYNYILVDSKDTDIKNMIKQNIQNAKVRNIYENFYSVKNSENNYLAHNLFIEKWNWNILIIKNVNYLKNFLEDEKKTLINQKKKSLTKLSIITIIIFFIGFLISYKIVNTIDKLILKYKKDLKKKIKENQLITDLNNTNEILLIDSAKNIQTSIFVNSLIHQWYKPLNNFSLKILNLKIQKQKNEKLFLEKFDKEIVDIEHSLDFISSTTQTFVSFFKNTYSNDKQNINLIEFFDEFKFIFDDTIKMNNIELNININSKSKLISNENLLKQIFLSLITNSIEAFKISEIPTKNINISFKTNNNSYVFYYSDNAGGINKKLLPVKLFDYKISSKENSLGLGLYICKLIIETKLNGTIVASNKENDNNIGAAFTFTIPKNNEM